MQVLQDTFDSEEANSSDSSSLNSSISWISPPLLDLAEEIAFITLDTETDNVFYLASLLTIFLEAWWNLF